MLQVPLDSLHRELGAKMVPFAGYDMPVQYPEGIIKEHLHTRAAAGLFDVSHMGQLVVSGPGTTAALEALVPVDLAALPLHKQSYALLTNAQGGVRDDLIITRWGAEEYFLVVNAACKDADIQYLREHMPDQVFRLLPDHGLLALQGPLAREVLSAHVPELAQLPFMQGLPAQLAGTEVYVTCSGYTGEDGFEISIPAAAVEAIARLLLDHPAVAAAGLGARDSLRLEAGLCLYGHELDTTITPVEAGLMWSVSPSRRASGERPGGFPGAAIVFRQQAEGVTHKRVGLTVSGRRPVRDDQRVLSSDGVEIGVVTSACYSPSLEQPVAMARIDAGFAEPGQQLLVDVRGKQVPVIVTRMPFVPQRYYRG